LAKDLANFLGEFSRRIRLLQSRARPKALARDPWLGIAGREQDFEVWLCGKRRCRQLIAIHAARHHDIGEDRPNLGMSSEKSSIVSAEEATIVSLRPSLD